MDVIKFIGLLDLIIDYPNHIDIIKKEHLLLLSELHRPKRKMRQTFCKK
jgi:hypothetical protein